MSANLSAALAAAADEDDDDDDARIAAIVVRTTLLLEWTPIVLYIPASSGECASVRIERCSVVRSFFSRLLSRYNYSPRTARYSIVSGDKVWKFRYR